MSTAHPVGNTEKIQIRRGLDVPVLGGLPAGAELIDQTAVSSVAIIGPDYPRMRPTLHVEEGDRVACGALVFECKSYPGVRYTAPGGGVVRAINRGRKRVFLSLIIDLEEDESFVEFPTYDSGAIDALDADAVQNYLIETGIWCALHQRPYGRVPTPGTRPAALFVNACSSEPLGASAEMLLAGEDEPFQLGLKFLLRLGEFPVYVCRAPELQALGGSADARVHQAEFSGPHPSGLSGTHMHFLAPATPQHINWSIDAVEVAALGRTLMQGRLSVERRIALGGSGVRQPKLVRTRMGASSADLLADNLEDGDWRVISGSPLSGHRAAGAMAYLGRSHRQVSVIAEGGERQLLRWARPGWGEYSKLGVFAGKLLGQRMHAFSTLRGGGERAILPVGQYEEVTPHDLLMTPLLKALVTGDIELLSQLGALELVEEDLALCTFVCPSKYEFAPILRSVLNRMEDEL